MPVSAWTPRPRAGVVLSDEAAVEELAKRANRQLCTLPRKSILDVQVKIGLQHESNGLQLSAITRSRNERLLTVHPVNR